LLDNHDAYAASLQARLEEMKPILRTIERREEILRERMEYEELQKDSERLKQRGAAMTKQLMKEEKMARRIKKELPKLTESLIEKLHEWKANHGESFVYHGDVYLSVMDVQEKKWQEYKAQEMHEKLVKRQQEKSCVDNVFKTAGASSVHNKALAKIRPLGNKTENAAQRLGRGNAVGTENAGKPRTAPARTLSTKQLSNKQF
jgi:protein regulator of cytokinesis 1